MANEQGNYGYFLPTTQPWDVQQLYEADITSPEFKELLVRMYQQLNNFALAINAKRTGYYLKEEFNVGSLYFPRTGNSPEDLRTVFCKAIEFGALPAANTIKPIPHGLTITAQWQWVNIYGTATDSVALTGIPLPYASANGTDNIELSVDNTNVIVSTGNKDYSAYSSCKIVLEYLKE